MNKMIFAPIANVALSFWRLASDTIIAMVFLVLIAIIVVPLGRVVYDYWHSTLASFQATPTKVGKR